MTYFHIEFGDLPNGISSDCFICGERNFCSLHHSKPAYNGMPRRGPIWKLCEPCHSFLHNEFTNEELNLMTLEDCKNKKHILLSESRIIPQEKEAYLFAFEAIKILKDTSSQKWAATFVDLKMKFMWIFGKDHYRNVPIFSTSHGIEFFNNIEKCLNNTLKWASS